MIEPTAADYVQSMGSILARPQSGKIDPEWRDRQDIDPVHKIMLERIFAGCDPKNIGPGIGWFRPEKSILIIGDQHGPSQQPYNISANIAFCDMAKRGSSYHMTKDIMDAGLSEEKLCLYWINAYNSDGQPTHYNFIPQLKPRCIISLGTNASKWSYCLRNSAPYFIFHHPQFHYRFHSKFPYPLIDALKFLDQTDVHLAQGVI